MKNKIKAVITMIFVVSFFCGAEFSYAAPGDYSGNYDAIQNGASGMGGAYDQSLSTRQINPMSQGGSTVSCSGSSVAGVCFPSGTGLPDPSGGVKQVVTNLLSWLLGIFGIIATIAFVISGMQYLTSAGNEDQISIAKRNMMWSIVGVLVGLSGIVIIQAINQALTASSTAF